VVAPDRTAAGHLGAVTASAGGPTVSIVVPCYNAAATVAETLDSALGAGPDVEVIAVDDGSTDGTATVLASFGDRIKVLSGPNRGVSAARNSGAALARGAWIQFLDSDDLLCPGTIDRRLEAAEAGADLVICAWQEFRLVDAKVVEGAVRAITPAAASIDADLAMATDAWAPPAAVLYRRALVEKIGGFRADLPVIQDARFLFDAVACGGKVAISDHIGARYRVLEGSLSRRNPGQFWADVLTNGRQIEALWRERNVLDERRRQAIRGIYNQAARGLFSARDARFFEAETELRRLGAAPLHLNIAGPLARTLGLAAAARLLSLVGKG
jgi:glycosyltransferase involved in cell wall biosynthesis